MKQRFCLHCESPLPEFATARKRYCNDNCRNRAKYLRDKTPIEPRECVYCGTVFTPIKRTTANYCSNSCSTQDNRPIQNSKNSPSVKRDNAEILERATWAFEEYKSLKLSQRYEWVQKFIDHPANKRIAANKMLIGSKEGWNIAKICDQHTQSHYGVRIFDYYD